MASMLTSQGAQDGFWGTVVSGLGTGIGKLASDALPTWAAGQLGIDKTADASANVSNPLNTSLGEIQAQVVNTSSKTMLWDDVTQNEAGTFAGLDQKTVIAAGLVLVAVIVLMKVM